MGLGTGLEMNHDRVHNPVPPERLTENYKVSMGCGTKPVNIFSSAETIKKAEINNLGSSSPGNPYRTYMEIPSLIYRH